MRIGDGSIESLGGGQVGSVTGSGTSARGSGASNAKSDSVNLSSAAGLVALAKTSSVSRQSKIDSLSAQIRSGGYQADDAQVSHAVVEGHIAG